MARLKKAEALRRKTAILLGKGTLRLPSLLQNRKLEVKKRIRIEQDLLLAYFNSQQVPCPLMRKRATSWTAKRLPKAKPSKIHPG